MNRGPFEWDSSKNESNEKKHGITFENASLVFQKPYLSIRSANEVEERFIALGDADGRIIAVIYTVREDRIRIISARAARKNEREIYHQKINTSS